MVADRDTNMVRVARSAGMSTTTVQCSSAEMDLVKEMYKNFRSWAIVSLVLGGVSVIARGIFDPGWGIVLITIAALSWKTRIPGMFAVYAVIMAWAAFMNITAGLSGGKPWWLGLGLMQVFWTVAIVKQYRKYRRIPLQKLYQSGNWPADLLPPQDEKLILCRFAIAGAVLAGINLFLQPSLCIGTVIFEISAQLTETPQIVFVLLSGLIDLTVLALGLCCAALLAKTDKKGLAISGAAMSGLQVIIWMVLWFLGTWGPLAGPT
jgi:hypothetical protein